jgi:hypothetical protein
MDFYDSYSSKLSACQPKRTEPQKSQTAMKAPAAPRAPMEYERRVPLIPRRPLWF